MLQANRAFSPQSLLTERSWSAKLMRHRIARILRSILYRVMGISFYRFPFRALFVKTASVFLGTAEILLWKGKLRLIRRYFIALGLDSGFIRFALRYILLTTRDILWANIIHDSPYDGLGEFVSVTGKEELQASVSEGRGVIVLGAHYGPPCYLYLLKRMCDLDVRLLVNSDTDKDIKGKASSRFPLFKDKRACFLSKDTSCLVAGRNELSLVKHVKRGGTVLILNDILASESSGMPVKFLDRDLSFNDFPFKMALRLDVPVFFCSLVGLGDGKYSLVLDRAGPFADQSNAMIAYVSFVEKLVRMNPYVWWQSIVTYCHAWKK